MKLLWTRSALPFSKLLCWGLQEPCSHFAVAFDCNDAGSVGTVFQADLTGCHITYYGTFLRTHQIVHRIDVPMALADEDNAYNSIVSQFDGAAYDYRYFLWMSIQALKHRFFGVPYPKVIPEGWHDPHKHLCFEVFQHLPADVVGLSRADWQGFLTPEMLYQSIDQSKLAAKIETAPKST